MRALSQLHHSVLAFIKPSEKIDLLKVCLFLGVAFTVYFTILIALITIWYSKNNNIDFHWFDDSEEWRLCDKFGHAYIAFTECRLAVNLFNWCGIKGYKNHILSFLIAFCMQSSYEVFDGFADDYGASIYDLIANATGAGLVIIQYYLFKRIIVSNKFNFSLTDYAVLRPNMLGDSFWSRYFKDYNGQTYWFSFNLKELTKLKFIPSWFMLSIGYGGDGLLGGHDNVWTDDHGETHDMSRITRASRWYISFDIDFSRLKTNIKLIDNLFYISAYLKIPLPGLELNTHKGLRWRWFCY